MSVRQIPDAPAPPNDSTKLAHMTVQLKPSLDDDVLTVAFENLRTDDENLPTYSISVEPDGNLILSGQSGPVRIKLKIVGSGWTWFEDPGPYLMYSEFPGDDLIEVIDDNKHHQIRHIERVSGKILKFTYLNKRRSRADKSVIVWNSAWSIVLKYRNKPYTYDPIISNGGNPSEEEAIRSIP